MSKRPALVIAIAILSAVAVVAPAHARAAYPYRLVEPATFGGPSSFLDLPGVPLTAQGILLGQADTTTPDSDYPKCPPPGGCSDSHIQHAFEWRSGRLIDLGALPGENSSAIFELNNRGVGAGFSENGLLDPYTGTAAGVAVMFKHDHVINLGTLPGGHESFALDINARGQVAGNSSNGTVDPFSIDGWGTQTRGFIWQNGVMKDLGTLGGPDATEYVLNEHGQITGWSYTNSTPNPATGFPTIDPFLWQNGRMRDLGTLGGTFGTTSWLNNHGQVVGNSDLAGDRTAHPFFWDGRRMLDLGTLGGDNGLANFVNESGDVVGSAQLPDGTFHAFLWRDGKMLDLPPVSGAPNANANGVNAQDQVVGSARDTKFNELDAVLWRHGRGYDLNTLIAPSALHLTSAEDINNQGEIIGHGVLPNGDQRIFVLIPNYRALTLAGYAASAKHQNMIKLHYYVVG